MININNINKLALCVLAAVLHACGGGGGSGDHGSEDDDNTGGSPPVQPYTESYRNQFHFSPESNWLNDPNGLVYLDGTYHMFYQYNPNGTGWGFMSWGHASSTDLVHWVEQDIAIRYAPGGATNHEELTEMIFSGSAIVDHDNVAGFGEKALLAYYTSHYPQGSPDHPNTPDIQGQSLAYSTDGGHTWLRYTGNPLLDIGSTDFRDPKVFHYDEDGQSKWIMSVAMAVDRKIVFYQSTNLLDWEKISEFGPANAVQGLWEVPDLFPLAVDGDPDNTKWVLLVSVGDGGAPNGGSGVQYFVGDFDGTRFVADNVPGDPSEANDGTLFEDFEAGYEQWTASGSAFGDRPAQGTLEGQQTVFGYLGDQLVNSFFEGDGSTGTLISDEFVITENYVNVLIGGGDHPASSPDGETTFNLYVNGERVRSVTGADSERLTWQSFDVTDRVGETGEFRIIDSHTGGWGHINVDHIGFSSAPYTPEDGTMWADYGADFYAPITFSNMPDDRIVTVGWANNWRYAGAIPTQQWRGSMSVARELALKTVGDRVRLVQQPVVELDALRTSAAIQPTLPMELNAGEADISTEDFSAQAAEIEVVFEVGSASEVGLRLNSGTGESRQLYVGYDADKGTLFIDRSRAGTVGFHPDFAARHEGPISLEDGKVRLRVYIDWSMVEVFGNEGETVLTDRFFPSGSDRGLFLYAQDGDATVTELEARELDSIWR